MDWQEAGGKIIYDPFRGGMKRDIHGWCIVDTDKEITRYYRWWLQRERHIILNQPSWDAHVSVVRGELSASRHAMWKKHQGRHIQFKYQHGDVQVSKDKDQPGSFYWIRVDCPEVDQIREELGLIASWRYHHLTIGRTHY